MQIKYCLLENQSKTVLNKYVGLFLCERTTGDGLFPLQEVLLWIILLFKCINARCLLQKCSFLLHKTLIDGLERCGLLVDYCDVFISCLDSHSDGTHSLQMIHCWASDVMLFLQICSYEQKTHLLLGWPEGEYIFSKFKFLGELFL